MTSGQSFEYVYFSRAEILPWPPEQIFLKDVCDYIEGLSARAEIFSPVKEAEVKSYPD